MNSASIEDAKQSTNVVEDPYTITMTNGSKIAVVFGEATGQQQLECYSFAGNTWDAYLDEDEVVAREKHLSHQPLARNGGCRIWCLYRQDDTGQILSTCRTVRRNFILKDAEDVHELEGYCVTSVYTPLLYRGHGLASHMLKNVAQRLDSFDEAAVSILYSNISGFYEKVGWTTLPNTEIVLSSNTWLQDTLGSYADLEVWYLSDANVRELCAQDIEGLRAEFRNANIGAEESRLLVLPTADLVRHQHALSDYMGDLWHEEAPKNRGVAFGDQAWLYWQHDFRGRRLYVQRIHNAIEDENMRSDIITALFLAACREANEWSFTSVTTWDVGPDVRNALAVLSQANVFNTGVRENQGRQKISLRWRYGEKRAGSVTMSNETFAWNRRG